MYLGIRKTRQAHNIGKPGQSHSWETYFQTGIGLGYILYPDEFAKLQQGINTGSSKLVMLRQDKNKRRAEARLTNLVRRGQAKNGQWRYDVYFEDQKEIKPYVYYLPNEKLKENGVKVF